MNHIDVFFLKILKETYLMTGYKLPMKRFHELKKELGISDSIIHFRKKTGYIYGLKVKERKYWYLEKPLSMETIIALRDKCKIDVSNDTIESISLLQQLERRMQILEQKLKRLSE